MVQEWATHNSYGSEFRDLLKSIEEEFGPPPQEVEPTSNKEKDKIPKRKSGSGSETATPATKVRKVLASEHLLPLDKIGDTGIMAEAPLPQLKQNGVVIRVMTGNRCFLINTADVEIKLPSATILAGFGQGNYKQRQANEEWNKEKEVLFQPQIGSLMLFNNRLCTLEDIVTTRLAKFPNSKILYHEMVPQPQPDKPHAWTLKKTADVVFVPNGKATVEEGPDKTVTKMQSSALLLPVSAWAGTAQVAEIVWGVRWAPAGLMPTRPQIVTVADLSLPPKQGCLLTK